MIKKIGNVLLGGINLNARSKCHGYLKINECLVSKRETHWVLTQFKKIKIYIFEPH